METSRLSALVDKFCAWYRLSRTWQFLQTVLFAAICAFGAYLLADKLLYFQLDRSLPALSTACLALLALLIFYVAVPRRRAYVGYLIDRALGLKNLVSAGLEVEHHQDEMSQLVAGRAVTALQSRKVSEIMPLSLTWAGRRVVVPAVIVAGLWFVPQQDLAGRKAKQELLAKEEADVKRGAVKLTEKVASIEQKLKDLESISGKAITEDLKALQHDLNSNVDRKEALNKIADIENKFKDEFAAQHEFEKMTKGMTANLADKSLAAESREALKQLTEDLKKGDLENAAKEMEKLAEQMSGDKLDEKQKDALAKQMEDITRQLQGDDAADKLAKALEDMKSSPMDPSSMDPSQKSQGKPDDQQQSAADKKAAQQNAADKMNEMAQSMKQMDAMQDMKDSLADARKEMNGQQFEGFNPKAAEEFMNQENQMAQLGEPGEGQQPGQDGKGQNGKGLDKDGTGQGQGQGQGKGQSQSMGGAGGEGKGGGVPPENQNAVAFKDEQDPMKMNKGKILNQMYEQGIPEKGEALAEYTAATKSAHEEALSSLAKNRVPREYESMVKEYFNSIDKKDQKSE